MLEICPLASGSSGNAICVGNDHAHVLIDAGVSGKRIEEGLNTMGLTGKDIDAIMITHEHIDHILCTQRIHGQFRHYSRIYASAESDDDAVAP